MSSYAEGMAKARAGDSVHARAHRQSDAGLYVFLIGFACAYYVANYQALLNHLDLGWHLAAGDLIRTLGHVPAQDSWSFTHGDRTWYNLSWLWDVAASIVFQIAGFGGLVFATVACGGAIVAALTWATLRSDAPPLAVCVSVLAAAFLFPSFATDPNSYLSASPNLATMVFAALFFAVCVTQRGVWLLPLAMVAWVNLHGGFPIGFLIVGVFFAVALLERDGDAAKRLAAAGLACVPAILVNPLGWRISDGVTSTLGHFVQAEITEWRPYHETMVLPGCLPAIAFMILFVALELGFRAKHPVPRAPRVLAWAFLALGLYQFRYMSFFFMFATIPMALHVGRVLPQGLCGMRSFPMLATTGAAMMCIVPVSFLLARPALGLSDLLSADEARAIGARFGQTRMLNHWNVGGLLIFHTQGKLPVFIDGRAATAYPDDLLRDYTRLPHRIVDQDAWTDVLDKYRIDTVLWVKAHEDLRRFLVDRKGWKEEFSTRYHAVYVRSRH